MLKEERFQLILDQLNQDKKVLLSTLSSLLGVSEDTVRRDIRELSDQGLLRAVRGGAVPHAPGPRAFSDRMQYANTGKQQIARKALDFIKEGQALIFDGGTSTLTLAGMIPSTLPLTVVTNSLPVAAVLESRMQTDVFFAGGRLLKNSAVTTGTDAAAFFRRFRADVCFLGICSIHPRLGVTVPDFEESEVKKAMIESSRMVIALATTEKLGTAEAFHVCDTGQLSVIITDTDGEIASLSEYRRLGIEVR